LGNTPRAAGFHPKQLKCQKIKYREEFFLSVPEMKAIFFLVEPNTDFGI